MAEKDVKKVDAGAMVGAASGLISPEASKKIIAGNKPVDPAAPAAAGNQPAPVGDVVAAPVVVKSPLGDQVYGGTPVSEIKLTSFEDVAAFAKDYAGVELKTVQDFVPVFGQLKELQKSAAEAVSLQKTVDTYKSTLDNLPKDVSLILNAAIQGVDHMPIIQKLQQKALFDFEKPITAHDEVDLINHYTGKTYTKETLDKLEPDAQEALMDVVKLKYKVDQDDYANLKVNTQSAIDNRQKAFRASVESSIAQMLVSNPKVDKTTVERVRQIMMNDLGESLFTKERTYLPDAAEKIAYMTFGKQIVTAQAQTIGDLVKKIRAEGESSATEKLLMRSDQPPLRGSGAPGDKNVLRTIVDKETSFIHAK